MIECGADIEYAMRWNTSSNKKNIQKSLFIELNAEEERIMGLFTENDELAIDEISNALDFPVSRVSATLLNLEFNGLVQSLPGKYFRKL